MQLAMKYWTLVRWNPVPGYPGFSGTAADSLSLEVSRPFFFLPLPGDENEGINSTKEPLVASMYQVLGLVLGGIIGW